MSIKNVKNINKRCGFKLNLIASSIMLIPAVAFRRKKPGRIFRLCTYSVCAFYRGGPYF